MKKNLCLILINLIFFSSLFCQTEQQLSVEEEIASINKKIQATSSVVEKIDLQKRLAKMYEYTNDFEKAEQIYVECADICSSERYELILAASRCSLSYGNSKRADELLAKIATQVRTNELSPIFKLYALWSWLGKCEDYEQTFEPIAILKSYLELESMKSVRPQILFTIWYVTGQTQYAEILKTDYPSCPEAEIVSGKIELMPSPFWYFVSRNL